MELHPILECRDKPTSRLWYVISCPGSPSPRVGQACVHNRSKDVLCIVGGADPSTTYNDFHELDLLNQTWMKVDCASLEERYEHCAFVQESNHDNLFIFAGANKSSNLNSLQKIDIGTRTCTTIRCNGNIPSPRTMHCAASDGDLLYVWGGGHQGSTPVSDLQLHVFDAKTHTWNQPNVKGKIPSARHGHVMVVVGKYIYIHGGMSGATFHKDLHVINLSDFSSSKVKPRGDLPSARAAHAACVFNKSMFIFGGMCADGALDDMHQFNTLNATWINLKFDCPPPTPRLDHSMVLAYLPYDVKRTNPEERENAQTDDSQIDPVASPTPTVGTNITPNIVPLDVWGSGENEASQCQTISKLSKVELGDESSHSKCTVEHIPVCIVFGGMDTSGNLFNDVLLLPLETV